MDISSLTTIDTESPNFKKLSSSDRLRVISAGVWARKGITIDEGVTKIYERLAVPRTRIKQSIKDSERAVNRYLNGK